LKRRATILGLAGVAAVATGVGTALRRAREESEDRAMPAASVNVWSLSFETVDGARLAMSQWRGRPLLLNFWATWCGPCVVEMPLLDRFAREQGPAGWRVLALAVDQPDPVRRFVAERALQLPVALAGGLGLDLSRQLGNTQGGLPFTAAFDSNGAAAHRRLGPVTADLLASWKAGVQ
jgi:thiol-disulfide isomerase/thioredoxin